MKQLLIEIKNAFLGIILTITYKNWYYIIEGAHSIVVERIHGMDQIGVRLPVGPQKEFNLLLRS